MATQSVDFFTSGINGDSNDTNQAAVKPIADGDPATAATFNKMPENLRTRTETLRQLFNDQLYLNDADRALLLSGGGTVSWGGGTTAVSPGTGIFTITSPVTVRPFMSLGAPQLSKRAVCVVDGPGTDTLSFAFSTASGATHAYGSGLGGSHVGGNDYTVTFSLGASFVVTIDGTPARNIKVQFVSGTTTTALATAMNAHAVFTGLGLVVTPSGTAPITVISDTPSTNTLPASPQKLLGALDAERHVVKAADVATFFATVGNRLQEGDVVGVYYDTLFDGAGGGRKESVPDYGAGAGTDKTGAGAFSVSLFNLRVNPEKAPVSIPLCTVVDDALVFLNGVSVIRGQDQNGLNAGFVQRSGDTMVGPLALTPPFLPASQTSMVTLNLPAYQVGTTPVAGTQFGLNVIAGTASGVRIAKTGGTGYGLGVSTAVGTFGPAVIVSHAGSVSALYVTSTSNTGVFIGNTASGGDSSFLVRNTGTGVGFRVDTGPDGDGVPSPTNNSVFITGPQTHSLLTLTHAGAGGSADNAVTLNITGSTGTGTNNRGIRVTMDNANAHAVEVLTGPGADGSGSAMRSYGKQEIEYTGLGAAITVNPSGGYTRGLVLTPTAPNLGLAVTGELGMEPFQPGASATPGTGARLRTGVGGAAQSCTKFTLALDAPWSCSGYYWLDAEGVVHLHINRIDHTSTMTLANNSFNTGADQFRSGGSANILPIGMRPLANTDAPCFGWHGSGPASYGLYFQVMSTGEFRFYNRSGSTTNAITYIGPVQLQYPLW